MNFLAQFNQMMMQQSDMAIATCTLNSTPNVRIVNFYYNPDNQGVIYFATFKGSQKTIELAENDRVSITTLPIENNAHMRVHNAKAIKSALTIYDLKEQFISKAPVYEMLIEKAGAMLDLYEVHFKKATVTMDFMNKGEVTFE